LIPGLPVRPSPAIRGWRSGGQERDSYSVYLEMNTRREEWSRCDMALEGLAVLHGMVNKEK
jgi:hypothetical protein